MDNDSNSIHNKTRSPSSVDIASAPTDRPSASQEPIQKVGRETTDMFARPPRSALRSTDMLVGADKGDKVPRTVAATVTGPVAGRTEGSRASGRKLDHTGL